MAIRVKLTLEPRYANRFSQLEVVRDDLAALDIEVGTDFEKFDLQLIQSSLLKSGQLPLTELEQSPVLIYERSDAATLGDDVFQRTLIARPEVRSWLKEFSFRDPSLHNEMMTHGRYHYTLINEDQNVVAPHPPTVAVGIEALEKITSIQPIYMFPQFDHCKTLARRQYRTRRTEVFYAGTIEYNHQVVKYHRYLAGMAIERLGQVTRVLGYGRIFGKREFQESLLEAKIFVSPYGMGEFSWKDYEAIYAGCVLIKPTVNFVTTYKFDIYRKDMYCVECRPDFGDLKDVVDEILSRQDHYEEFAERARHSLLAASTVEDYAPDFAAMVRSALQTEVERERPSNEDRPKSIADREADLRISARDIGITLGEEFLPPKAMKAGLQDKDAFLKLLTGSRKRYAKVLEERMWERLPHEWVMVDIGDGVRLWVSLADYYAKQILRDGFPKLDMMPLISEHLRPGTVFVDAGANVGWHAIHVARGQPEAAGIGVIAIEPQPDVASYLTRSAVASGVECRVDVMQVALGAEAGEAIVHRMRTNLSGAITFRVRGKPGGELVRQSTLDELVGTRGPVGVIKLSIEGSEYLAMQGAREVLRRDRPVVLGSLNCRKLQQLSGVTLAAFADFMSGFDYSLRRVASNKIQGPLELQGLEQAATLQFAFIPEAVSEN